MTVTLSTQHRLETLQEQLQTHRANASTAYADGLDLQQSLTCSSTGAAWISCCGSTHSVARHLINVVAQSSLRLHTEAVTVTPCRPAFRPKICLGCSIFVTSLLSAAPFCSLDYARHVLCRSSQAFLHRQQPTHFLFRGLIRRAHSAAC